MKKRRYSITASEEDIVPVIASYFKSKKGGLPKNTNLSLLACDSCNSQVLGSNSVNPFCVCCASDMKAVTEENLAVSGDNLKNDFEEIADCKDCGTTIAIQKDVTASFDDDAFYCPTCTANIQLKAADEDDEDSDAEDDTSEDDASGDDMSDTVDSDTDNTDDTDSTLFDNDSDEGGDTSDTSADSTDTDTSDTDTSDSSDDASNDDSASTSDSSGSTLSANLVNMVAGKEGDLAISASPDKSKWFLFFNNMPIASASKDNASDNVKAVFDNDKFATAWNAAIADGVSEDTLNDFGFTALTTDVPVDEAVKQNLEASINEYKSKNTMTAQDVRNRYERCVGIAAVGINKQVFKENNPVFMSLVASLSNARVRNPERMVLKAFEEHGEEYLANIAEKASELMDKSDDTLDTLAKTVDEAKYTKIEDNTNSIKQPKIAPFPKAPEPKIEEVQEEVELAASDIDDTDTKVFRMFSGLRHRS
jgi:hypothetical protein